jgi:hypothetical protein
MYPRLSPKTREIPHRWKTFLFDSERQETASEIPGGIGRKHRIRGNQFRKIQAGAASLQDRREERKGSAKKGGAGVKKTAVIGSFRFGGAKNEDEPFLDRRSPRLANPSGAN